MKDELTNTLELEANINEIVGSWDENTLITNSFERVKKFILHTFPFRPTVI